MYIYHTEANKMSQFPKLNIDIRDLTKKPRKIEFLIEPEPEPPPKRINKYIYVGALIILCFVISMYIRPTGPTIRKIIRMNCNIGNMQVCTAYGHGEYVVNTNGCPSFEFNGIPFTDLYIHKDNYRVPASPDMSLTIIDPCPTIMATVDTQIIAPAKEYARKGGIYTKRVVWITKSCYTEFTLNMGQKTIFEQTPTVMIGKEEMSNYTAYTYQSAGVSGHLSIRGNGCSEPIHIYSI